MVSLEEAKKNIRQELKSHYGENLAEIVGSPLVKHLQNDLVIDATVDVDKKFRITVYLNTRDMVDDEPNELYESAQEILKDNPNHIIIILDAVDMDYDESWLGGDYPEFDKTEGLWVLPMGELTHNALKEQVNQMFNVLDGKVWKIGCRPGHNKDMHLLMIERKCPKCGQKVWVPDHIVFSVLPVENYTEKPWIYSLESIHVYCMNTVRQIADIYNKSKSYGGLMNADKVGFKVDCACCGTETINFKEADREWFQHEQSNIWYLWPELEEIPSDMKLIPLSDVDLSMEDVDTVNGCISCMDGVIFLGEYSLVDFIQKTAKEEEWDRLIEDVTVIELHLMNGPMFKAKMPGSLAEIAVSYCHETLFQYAKMCTKSVNTIIGKE